MLLNLAPKYFYNYNTLKLMSYFFVALTDLQNEVQRLTSRAQFAEANAEKLKEEAETQKQQVSSFNIYMPYDLFKTKSS